MQTLRRIARDRFRDGLVAILVVHAMLLQGLVGGYASATMAGSQAGATQVICASQGSSPAGDPEGPSRKGSGHDCCQALCQLACSASVFLAAKDLGPAFAPEPPGTPRSPVQGPPARLTAPGLLAEARAPPVLSIDA